MRILWKCDRGGVKRLIKVRKEEIGDGEQTELNASYRNDICSAYYVIFGLWYAVEAS